MKHPRRKGTRHPHAFIWSGESCCGQDDPHYRGKYHRRLLARGLPRRVEAPLTFACNLEQDRPRRRPVRLRPTPLATAGRLRRLAERAHRCWRTSGVTAIDKVPSAIRSRVNIRPSPAAMAIDVSA